MSKLLDVENKFQNYLLHSSQDIFNHVVGTCKVPVEIRLGIYENAYRARLHEALITTYPALQSYLGDEQFEELCFAYIDTYPSEFRSIRWFGDKLANFMSTNLPYQEFPYLSELAKLEWTMSLVFDAVNAPVLQLEDMQNVSPEAWGTMRLQIHPSAHRLSFSWNTVQIWQATDEQRPPEPQEATSMQWLFWRNELSSQFCSLPEDEAWAIDRVINESTFGELCEGLCQWVDEKNAGMHAASLLKGWITAGLISQVII